MEQPNKVKERMKLMLQEIRDESAKMCDTNVKSENCKAILLIGLTQKDYEALKLLSARYPKIKNYGVLVRRVLREEAKWLPKKPEDVRVWEDDAPGMAG